MSEERERLKALFDSTPECPPLDELLEARQAGGADVARQTADCPRCVGEVALYEQFIKEPPADEVDPQMLRRIHRRLPTASAAPSRVKSWIENLWRPIVWAPAAVALAGLLVAIGLDLAPRSPVTGGVTGELVERGQAVELVSPRREINVIPADLRWNLLAGARTYRVKLMEVDRHVLWEVETKQVSVSLPSEIRKQVLPGKRLLWTVEAFDGNHQAIGQGRQDFWRAIAIGKAAK